MVHAMSESTTAADMGQTTRLDATCRRAQHDLHHLLHDVRHIFLRPITRIPSPAEHCPRRNCLVHYCECQTDIGLEVIEIDARQQARYYETKDPQFHQDAYAVLTATVVFSNMWIMEYRVRPRLEEREKLRPADTNIPPSNATMSDMWKMVATGQSFPRLPN